MKHTPDKIGHILNSRATHHGHGNGWTWTRNTGELEHIRFTSDHTGYNHWTQRLRRALNWKHLTGRDEITKSFRSKSAEKERYQENKAKYGFWKANFLRLYPAIAWFKVSMFKDTNRPDGTINGNLIFWEEDGEYIEMVGPTVGEKIAEFLIAEPSNPHAVAISNEIQRIWALPERGK